MISPLNLNQSEPEFGFCPMLGASYPVSASPIQTPGGGVTGSVTVQGACIGPRCRWWNGSNQDCVVKDVFAIPDLASSLQGIEKALLAIQSELGLFRIAAGVQLKLNLIAASGVKLSPSELERLQGFTEKVISTYPFAV